ncbi:MAG TPA: xanthine dehydrogenase family protein subunit M, partial [bacterium]|nr:xanthine dehydrogenase family protein subunit M [bacterium]
APIPWRAKKAEAFLAGKEITEDTARQAGELAVDGAFALPDNAEKVDITKAIVQAAVLSLRPGSTAVETPLLY